MLEWLSQSVQNIGEWLGAGISHFFDWLLGGIYIIFQAIVEAAGSLFRLLDALWNFVTTLLASLGKLLSSFFPFIPAPVMAVVTAALLVAAIAGVVKRVRKG